MAKLVKIIVVILAFCIGFTLGQGKQPLDFNGDGHLGRNDLNTALGYLTDNK